jgi:hypothetical protein
MEVEQRVIIKFRRFKFTKVFDEETCALPSVKYWIHQLKIGRTIMTDDRRPGRPSIDHIEALSLKQLIETPVASVPLLSKDL